ncbi:hypothetical protein RFI_06521 [Reticulomyxa filosa]|uniref:Uncharacterized protein n=1 Tax=Reticulomyxa filosa TaxID=46433 RepID=X6NWB1_RETFI|nr:hypothetical protein RFI_06521 [Reticulomyxa filosa]|eukprot:ETO30600.1 hypothetical protein RFI_06521 [Reticulomyxa filosa]
MRHLEMSAIGCLFQFYFSNIVIVLNKICFQCARDLKGTKVFSTKKVVLTAEFFFVGKKESIQLQGLAYSNITPKYRLDKEDGEKKKKKEKKPFFFVQIVLFSFFFYESEKVFLFFKKNYASEDVVFKFTQHGAHSQITPSSMYSSAKVQKNIRFLYT